MSTWMTVCAAVCAAALAVALPSGAQEATTVQPADGSTVSAFQMPTLRLRWAPDPEAASYQVYFGTNRQAVATSARNSLVYRGRTLEPYRSVAGLRPRTQYYWRVDVAREGGGVTRGVVHHFRTGYPVRDVKAGTFSATDALGRRVAEPRETPRPRAGRRVGIFYWTWHHAATGPFNVSRTLAENPEALTDYEHPAWGPWSSPHHWNEPLFGYYWSTDRWVIRKHAEMLADAGVDVVFFDCTNGNFTWDAAYKTLCSVYHEARCQGVRTPQIAFMLPFAPTEGSRESLVRLYRELYKPGLYRDLWFVWKGKPFIMAYPESVPEVPGDAAASALHREIRAYFTFRPGQPDYVNGPTRPDQWGWLENYPQHGYVRGDDGRFEQVTVGVAQNASDAAGGHCCAFNLPLTYGRSYTKQGGHDNRVHAHHLGLNFAEQWTRVFDLDPEFVFITGWNEWVAGRHREWGGRENAFPDQYDNEHSRDIEPMVGGHGDNYYYQMMDRIRRFKGTPARQLASAPKTVHIDGRFADWARVGPVYRSHLGNTLTRDYEGYGGKRLTNDTGRNDIIEARVARDQRNIAFLVKTTRPLTSPAGPNWMWLLIDIDANRATGWEGYDFILNRVPPSGGRAVLERCTGGWTWQAVARVPFAVTGGRMEVAIPRTVLGLTGGRAVDFDFKWVDNAQKPGDVMDFYVSGDAAPGGRMNFRYTAIARRGGNGAAR